MNNQYNIINQVNRAIDIYNFPDQNSVLLHLQSIRLLYDKRRYKESLNLRYMPSVENLKQRLLSIHHDIMFSRNIQHINEFMDTVLHIQVALPTLDIDAQLNEYNRYMNINDQNRKTKLVSLSDLTKDKQNVHNSNINESVKRSVIRIMDLYRNSDELSISHKRNIIFMDIVNILKQRKNWSPKNDKSISFIESNISTFGIDTTLKELFIAIYLHITKRLTDYKEELLDIFNDELKDMSGKCSTGHMSRLINILQGFDDTFSIKVDNNKIIKRFIYNYLNDEIKNFSEDILDNMIENKDHIMDIVKKEIFINKFKQEFGENYEEHKRYIDECVESYINPL